MVFETPNSNFNKDLVYDLRSSYALLVGEHLKDIAESRKMDNYTNYFKALEDLHIIVRHKFKTDSDEVKYQQLKAAASIVANKYKEVWSGLIRSDKAVSEIEQALHNIEMFLYEAMDRAHMFGSNKQIVGL